MKVIYKDAVSELIYKEKDKARKAGREISKIILTLEEYRLLCLEVEASFGGHVSNNGVSTFAGVHIAVELEIKDYV